MFDENKTLIDTLKKEIFMSKDSQTEAEEALYADEMPYELVKEMMEVGGYRSKIKALRKAFEQGIDLKELFGLIHKSDGAEEVRVIATALKMGLDVEKVKIVADGKHNCYQMEAVFSGFYAGRNIQEMELATDNRYDQEQIEEILSGFQRGLTYDQVEVYAKNAFDEYQMRTIKEGYLYHKLTVQEAQVVANPCYNTKQMREVIHRIYVESYKKGL